MKNIESGPSKLDVEILVHGTDEDMQKLLNIISDRGPSLCVPAKIEMEKYTSKPRRRVTFSIPGSSDFMLETARDWLDELQLDGHCEVNAKVTPLGAK